METQSETISTNKNEFKKFCNDLEDLFKQEFDINYQEMIEYSFNYICTDFEDAFIESIERNKNYENIALSWFNYHLSEIKTVFGFCS